MWQQASDWALRRLLKALLKRHLKALLATELDVEQLRVSLGRGSLELRDVLLSPEWLAQHAPPGVEVVSGYAGRLALDLSLAGLSCGVALEDVMLSLRPAPPPPPPPPSCTSPEGAPGLDLGLGMDLTAGSGAPELGADAEGPDDGLRLVAAGVEALVQRTTVTLTRLSVRLEGWAPGSAACLSCAEVVYGAAAAGPPAGQAGEEHQQPDAGGEEVATTARHVSFAGLCLSVGEEVLLAPLAGTLDVVLAWPLAQASGRQPRITVAAALQGAQVQATPCSLAALLDLARSLPLGAHQGRQQQEQQGPATVLDPGEVRAILSSQQRPARQQRPHPGSSSLLEELMLPGGGERLVQEALAGGGSSLTGQEEVDEFFDARSLLGSLQQAFSSAMAASLAPDAGEPGCASAHQGLAASRAVAMHDLAASVRQDGGASGRRWSVSLSCPSLSLSLLYPQQQGAAPSPAYAPRLAAEALRLAAWLEAESPANGGRASLSLGVGVGEVEVAEHLPFPSPSPASSATAAAAAAWVPAEEMARVPALLPGVAGMRWELPTFAGDYPVPDDSCGEGVGGTLAQLAGLSAATAYLSAAATLDHSMLLETAAGQDAAALPRVQIVPVLRCGGEAGAALAAHGSLAAVQRRRRLDLDVLLQPVSIWCTLPLLERLQSLAAAVAELAEQGPATLAADHRAGSGTSQRAAVAAAIDAVMREQQQQQQQQQKQGGQPAEPVPLRVSVYLPGACILASVPGSGAAAADTPKYFALCAMSSSNSLLCSLAPRLGSQQAQVLVQGLKEAGVEPSLELRRGGGDSGGTGGARAWACAVRLASLAVHALAEEGVIEAQPGDSVLGAVLALARVATMEGEGAAGQLCLSIDATWCQLASRCPPLLDELWAAAEAGTQPGTCAPLQRLAGGAPLLVSVRGHVPLAATLGRGTLAAASALADGVLRLSAAPPPAGGATQAALELECEVRCEVAAAVGAPFCVVARAVSARACANVDGVAGSSALALSVGGVELTRREGLGAACEGERSRVLAHSSGQQQADGQRRPAAQLLVLLRPTGDPCQLCSNGRYVLPCRGRVNVGAAGLTLLLDDAGRLPWLQDVQAPAVAGGSAPGCPPGAAGSSLPPPPPLSLDWAVSLLGSAVRYEPRDSSMVAALLTISSLAWAAGPGQPQSSVQAKRLSLHLAAARQPEAPGDARGGGPARVPCSVPPSAPEVAGFHQVAAEAGLTLRMPWPRPPQQEGVTAAAVREVALSSSALSLSLSRHTLSLLRRLLDQLAAQRGNSSEGPPPHGSSSEGASPRGSIGGEGVPSRRGVGGGVDVMRDVVQAAYAAPPRPQERPAEASVFLDGGWYDAEGAPSSGSFAMSPAGSPPAVVGRDWLQGFAEGRQEAREEQGVWYGGGSPPRLMEGYVAVAAPSEGETAACFGSPDFDCLLLPPKHPQPDKRVSVRFAAITLTLADTFATVLLPEEDEAGWEEGQAGEAALAGSRSGSSGGAGLASGGAAEEELVALSAQVQARLEGVTLQLDTWADQGRQQRQQDPQQAQQAQQAQQPGAAAPGLRLALAVRGLEVRDSFQARQGASGLDAAGAAPAAGWAGLRRMLGYHASVRRVRGPSACVVQVVVEGVQAEPGADVEYRVRVQLLPLLLHLDQAALAFLQHLLAPHPPQPAPDAADACGVPGACEAAPCPPGGSQPFFQRCEVLPFTLTIHYRPHRVDLAALSGGQLGEVLNLVPWGGVSLSFRHLRLSGMQGLAGLGTALASAYVEDIARHQAHRFVGGIAPIKSICRVSAAAAQLVAIPRQQLYQRSSGDSAGALALTALADQDFRRQMQRGLAGLVRAVALEALNLGASLAAGAEVALAGQASASHTASTTHALRQAGAQLRSSAGGPRSAASAAATAVRTALLGVRNTLDREHTLERRLNS